jgi:hypothetical protein
MEISSKVDKEIAFLAAKSIIQGEDHSRQAIRNWPAP